jgi:hypothetical protein
MANKGGRGSTGQRNPPKQPTKPSSGGSRTSSTSPRTTWRSILLNGVDLNRSAYYGQPGSWSLGYHTGTDFAAAGGTIIRSPVSGVVVSSKYDGSYGNTVVIQMPDGYYMRFAHMSTKGISVGTKIMPGSYIGKVGSTGRSTGNHLHLEVMKPSSNGRFGKGNFVDPVGYLDKRKLDNPADLAAPIPDPVSGGSSGSGSTGGGGGGISGVAGYTKKDYMRWLDAKFGSIAMLRKLDAEARKEVGGKSIDWLVNTLAKEKITDDSIVLSYMMKTGWFKKYGEETSARLVTERARPGVFKDKVQEVRSGVQAALDALGVGLDDKTLNQIARDSYVYGWSVAESIDEAQKMFTESGDVTYDGGEIGRAQDDLESAAWDLGVDLTEADIRSMRSDVIDGKGYQSQLDALRERSAAQYGVFADQIMAGQSLRSVASAYFQKAADLLELGSPDQVEMDDPLVVGGKAFMAADPATGKMVPKGLWDFEKEIRKDSRWLETNNARSTVLGQAGQILSLMGLG